MNNENIFNALGIFIEAMRPFTIKLLQKHFPNEPWEGVFFKELSTEQQKAWNQAQKQGTPTKQLIDYHNLSFLATKFRDELANEIGGKNNTYKFDNCIRELQEARNKCQHFNEISDDEKDRTFSNIITVANMLGMQELRNEIDSLKKRRTSTPVAVASVTSTIATEDDNTNIPDDGSLLKPWFAACKPHYDIRNNVLDESTFAANLSEVALGTGPEEYNNPMTFFSKTYVTAGMRDIMSTVVRALNGEETTNRVVSLQTGFGGGKTHTLISLYHIAKGGRRLLSQPSMQNLLPEGVAPIFNDAKVAVFTNNTTDIVQGRPINDTLTIHTLWGEIAYQLGGEKGYEKVRSNDESLIAPNAQIMKPILEHAGTSLILIDELADYCTKAIDRKNDKGNLYTQTNSFVQTLTEVVSQVPRSVLIVTLPASATEVANTQIGTEVLQSLQARLSRIATSIKPVDDMEVYEVVRHRLFESIDNEVIKVVVKRYKDMLHNRRTDLPPYCDRVEYARKLNMSYPFHPELIEMLRQRWGSYHQFQRTRGVLRLLASIVQDLWKRRHNLMGSNVLIHTSDICLENLPTWTSTITSLVGAQWEAVMAADIYGTNSNAKRIDDENPNSALGQFLLTQGVAKTLLLASLGATTNKGLTIKELKLCLLRPNAFRHGDIDTALNKLGQTAHYLHSSGTGETAYWFETRPNINILLNQAEQDIKPEEITAEIRQRLNRSKQSVNALNMLICPTADVPEQKRLTLIVLDPKYTAPSKELEEAVKNIALRRGNANRTVKNTIFYLACSENGRAALTSETRKFLACDKVIEEYEGRLESDQKTNIKQNKEERDKKTNNALTTAYNTIIRYTRDGMETLTMIDFAADFSKQINEKLIERVIDEEWIIRSISGNLLKKNNLLPTVENPVKVKDVYEAFLNYNDKPMITGTDAVKKTVDRYCREGLFNVGVKSPNGGYTQVYSREQVPLLNVESDDYWLVDTSVTIHHENNNDEDIPTVTGNENTTTNSGEQDGSVENSSTTYKKLIIHGSVPIENYSQLFTSFINTLKCNKLTIEVRFTAENTTDSPLTDSSQLVQNIKESARQLGLKFETEG